jgi:hypothetical protein
MTKVTCWYNPRHDNGLRSYSSADQIECNACVRGLGFKRPVKLTTEGLCSIHPAVTGVDRREEPTRAERRSIEATYRLYV